MTKQDLASEAKIELDKCTFSLGYIRQPIYACKTCLENNNSDSSEPAGICYSCSIACHATHELFELFPKRNFRCDCGLPGKLDNHSCSLMIPAKKILRKNDKNQYNHNFQGRYCSCDNKYDPGKEEHVMYQCVACEDWFHQHCIGNIPEEIEDFECYVCRECTKKYPFLLTRKDARFSFGLSKGNENVHKWILNDSLTVAGNDKRAGDKRKATGSTTTSSKKQKSSNNCQTGMKFDLSSLPDHDNIEIFLQETWREGLCRCIHCMVNYTKHHVEFLLEEEKTYEPEEDEDEDVGKSLVDIGWEQLQRVDRVEAIESLKVYKSLANDIKSYLESFESSGKILTQQDLEAFFAVRLKRQEKE